MAKSTNQNTTIAQSLQSKKQQESRRIPIAPRLTREFQAKQKQEFEFQSQQAQQEEERRIIEQENKKIEEQNLKAQQEYEAQLAEAEKQAKIDVDKKQLLKEYLAGETFDSSELIRLFGEEAYQESLNTVSGLVYGKGKKILSSKEFEPLIIDGEAVTGGFSSITGQKVFITESGKKVIQVPASFEKPQANFVLEPFSKNIPLGTLSKDFVPDIESARFMEIKPMKETTIQEIPFSQEIKSKLPEPTMAKDSGGFFDFESAKKGAIDVLFPVISLPKSKHKISIFEIKELEPLDKAYIDFRKAQKDAGLYFPIDEPGSGKIRIFHPGIGIVGTAQYGLGGFLTGGFTPSVQRGAFKVSQEFGFNEEQTNLFATGATLGLGLLSFGVATKGIGALEKNLLKVSNVKFEITQSSSKQIKGLVGGSSGKIKETGTGFLTTTKEVKFGLSKFVPKEFLTKSEGVRFEITKTFEQLPKRLPQNFPNKFVSKSLMNTLEAEGKRTTFLRLTAVGKSAKAGLQSQADIVRREISGPDVIIGKAIRSSKPSFMINESQAKFLVRQTGTVSIGGDVFRSREFPFKRIARTDSIQRTIDVGSTSIQSTTALKEFSTITFPRQTSLLKTEKNIRDFVTGKPSGQQVSVTPRFEEITKEATARSGKIGFVTGSGKVPLTTKTFFGIGKKGPFKLVENVPTVESGFGTFSQRVTKTSFPSGIRHGIETGRAVSGSAGKFGGITFRVQEQTSLIGRQTFVGKRTLEVKRLKDIALAREIRLGTRSNPLQQSDAFRFGPSRREARLAKSLGEKYIPPALTPKQYFEKVLKGKELQSFREIPKVRLGSPAKAENLTTAGIRKIDTQFGFTKRGEELLTKELPAKETGLKVKDIVHLGRESQPIRDISIITGKSTKSVVKGLGKLPVEGFTPIEKIRLGPDVGAVTGPLETGRLGVKIRKLSPQVADKTFEESILVHEFVHGGERVAGITSGRPKGIGDYFISPSERRAYAVQERFLESKGRDLPAGILFQTGVKGDTSLISRVIDKSDGISSERLQALKKGFDEISKPRLDSLRKQLMDAFRTRAPTVSPKTITGTKPKPLFYPSFNPATLSRAATSSRGFAYFPQRVTLQTPTVTRPIITPVSKTISRPVTSPLLRPSIRPATTPITRPITFPLQVPISTPIVTPKAVPITRPIIRPLTSPITRPITQPIAKPLTGAIITPITFTVQQPPPIRVKRFDLPQRKQRLQKYSFIPILFRRGKPVRRLSSESLTYQDALAVGSRFVQDTIKRSFKLVPSGGLAQERYLQGPTQILRRGKRDPFLFVEKSQFAISTPGEKTALRIGRTNKLSKLLSRRSLLGGI